MQALSALGEIALSVRGKQGRKLLIWVGPGWGIGTGTPFFSNLDREQLFNGIDWFSTVLREARIALYTLSEGEKLSKAGTYQSAFFYQEFLPGVKSEDKATIGNLDRRVIAEQSGGRVIDPHKDLATSFGYNGYDMTLTETASRATEITHQIVDFDLVSEINSCVAEGAAYYTLSFNPPLTDKFDEYHELKVEIARPGLTARTSMGYYNRPYFYDRPNPAARSVTIEQLRQELLAAQSKRDAEIAWELANLELTEQVSGAELASLQRSLKGTKSRDALLALADESAFVDPPATEIPADAPPDQAAQQRMIALAVDYQNKTITKLPNLFATRTTNRFEESPEQYDLTGRKRIPYQPLHWVDNARDRVLYRNGNEVVESEAKKKKGPNAEELGLTTKGAFGPILGAVTDALSAPGGLTWSRWEKGANGLRAVFRFAEPEQKSRFKVGYCCLPEGDGTSAFLRLTAYHGEIAIDPADGSILRIMIKADLNPGAPMFRADTGAEYSPAEIGGAPLLRVDHLVEYGPVEIGGKTYICPVKSISIARARSVKVLTGLPGEFRTFGPYATKLNDVKFDDYHVFRAESRLLPGFEPVPEKK
jgi:hypothetical protein